jgi:8-oxo-dGTP diphosphatase
MTSTLTLTVRLILTDITSNKILFLAQTKINGGGFTLPGGKVDRTEFIKEGLIRESFEEAGIVLKKKDLKLALVMHKKLKTSSEVIFFFKSNKWSGTIETKEPLKFKHVVWYDRDQLPLQLSEILKTALLKEVKGKNFIQFPK